MSGSSGGVQELRVAATAWLSCSALVLAVRDRQNSWAAEAALSGSAAWAFCWLPERNHDQKSRLQVLLSGPATGLPQCPGPITFQQSSQYRPWRSLGYLTLSGKQHVGRLTCARWDRQKQLSHIRSTGDDGAKVNSIWGDVTWQAGSGATLPPPTGSGRPQVVCLAGSRVMRHRSASRQLKLAMTSSSGISHRAGRVKAECIHSDGITETTWVSSDDSGTSFLNQAGGCGSEEAALPLRLVSSIAPRGRLGSGGGVNWLLRRQLPAEEWREAWRLSLKKLRRVAGAGAERVQSWGRGAGCLSASLACWCAAGEKEGLRWTRCYLRPGAPYFLLGRPGSASAGGGSIMRRPDRCCLRQAVMSSQRFISIGRGEVPPLWRVAGSGVSAQTGPGSDSVTNAAVRVDGSVPLRCQAARIAEPASCINYTGRESGVSWRRCVTAWAALRITLSASRTWCPAEGSVCVQRSGVPLLQDPLGHQLMQRWGGGGAPQLVELAGSGGGLVGGVRWSRSRSLPADKWKRLQFLLGLLVSRQHLLLVYWQNQLAFRTCKGVVRSWVQRLRDGPGSPAAGPASEVCRAIPEGSHRTDWVSVWTAR
ncbi:L-fucose kinase [Lates japonicus]|uniref:L-fucose kinase n=1 Tax=Lates japonicus TaxID=270547 RepID=A0AAD3MYS1_LATJO|nr:L-fucose kinase [Lates japonicus]